MPDDYIIQLKGQPCVKHRKIALWVFLLLFGITLSTVAQKQGNFWYFGNKAALDFTNFDPQPLASSQMVASEGVAAISDENGNLLFYTNGINIWNSDHSLMNSNPLAGDSSSTQAATIIPDLNTPGQYFVFITKSFVTGGTNNYGGNYYIISLSGGTGSVIYDYAAATETGGLAPNATEKLAVVPFTYSFNKTGYWFLMHEFNSNRFIKVKLDSIWHDPIYQAIGSVHENDTLDDGTNRGAAGQMKVNDLGTRIALAVSGTRFFELFRFMNDSTGLLSNPMQIPAGSVSNKFAYAHRAYGVEFSPTGRYGFEPTSGNFLYGTTSDGGPIYQWDLSQESNFNQLVKSGKNLFSSPEVQCGALQIAPNGKIYVAFNGKDYLGVINSPTRPYPSCNFSESGARLIDNDTGLGGESTLGLPAPIPIKKDPEPFYFENLCDGDETLFYITDQQSITPNTPRVWIFTNLAGGSPVTRNSTLNEIRYKFPVPGTYRVQLRVFKSGVPIPYERILTINPLPVVSLAGKDTVYLCRGSELKVDAGYGAFYQWEDPDYKERRRTISENLQPIDEYRVLVTDYHGCQGWDTIWVERKIPPTIVDVQSTRAFCGNQDGSVTVFPNGNVANYNYIWEGFPAVNSNTLSGVNGGDYIVHVIHKTTFCEVVDTVHVEELGGSSVKIVSSGDPVVCPGVSIKLEVTGSNNIEWMLPSGLTGNIIDVTLDTTTVFKVKAISTDAGRSCETFLTDTIFVFPKNIPELGADRTSCAGWVVEIDGGEEYTAWEWSDGQTDRVARVRTDQNPLVLVATDLNGCKFSDDIRVKFNPSPTVNLGEDIARCSKDPVLLIGGTGEEYWWSTGETTQSIMVRQSGDYILRITKDGCSLEDTIHVQLNDPASLHIQSVTKKDVTCFGAENGEIQVVATGDGSNFYYTIDNGISYHDNNGLFENVAPGLYNVRVYEDSVCAQQYPEKISIAQPEKLVAKFCSLPPSCSDCSDGVITLALISGGVAPYEIRMNGVVCDSCNMDLGLGNYTMTVTDAQLCTTTVPILFAAGTRPEILSTVDEPVCPGVPITLSVNNSQEVEWLNPTGNTENVIEVRPMQTTTYRVRSIKRDEDNLVCETILEYTIEVIPYVPIDLDDKVSACIGETISLDGGDYVTWSWSNGSSDRYINLLNPENPLILTVTDQSGCTLKDTTVVNFAPHPLVDLGKDKNVCMTEPLTLEGGSGEEYWWSTEETTREILVTESGIYSLTITTDGCSTTDSVNVKITAMDAFTIDQVSVTDNNCFGDELGSLEIQVSGTANNYRFSIDDGVTYQSENQFYNLTSDGSYRIWVVADSICFLEYPEPVVVAQPDSIGIAIRLKSPTCEACSDGKLTAFVSGGTPPYQISLSGRPIEPAVDDLAVGSYVITVTDANLCSKTYEFTLDMLNKIPNVITTNGDGVNDYWKIPMLKYYEEAVVKVFNGSGKLVYESVNGYKVPWDGRENGAPLPMGTYYYLINLGPGQEQLSGNLTILR